MADEANASARASQPPWWVKLVQPILTTAMVGLMGYIASQYVTQNTRLAIVEIRTQDNSEDIIDLKGGMQRIQEAREKDMEKITALLQRIEDKIDRKADK